MTPATLPLVPCAIPACGVLTPRHDRDHRRAPVESTYCPACRQAMADVFLAKIAEIEERLNAAHDARLSA